jgi:hypothetical protein
MYIFNMTVVLFAGVRRRSFRSVRRKRKRRGQELFELPRTKNREKTNCSYHNRGILTVGLVRLG